MKLAKIYQPIEKDLLKIEKELCSRLKSEDSFINELNQYIIEAAGKRLRPALVLFSYGLSNRKTNKNTILLAVVVELIHTATLLHDDVLDNAFLRRKIPTVNTKWNNEISILLGDYLYSKASTLLSSFSSEIIKRMAIVVNKMCEGEIKQIRARFNAEMKIRDYIDMVNKKTAMLMSACCEIGAMSADAEQKDIDAVGKYGMNLGIAFQIVDDCISILKSDVEAGKTLNSDIEKGEMTLPLIYMMSRINNDEKQCIIDMFKSKEIKNNEKNIIYIKRLAIETNAVDDAFNTASKYIAKARKTLDLLREFKYKNNLLLLSDYVMHHKGLST